MPEKTGEKREFDNNESMFDDIRQKFRENYLPGTLGPNCGLY